MNQLKCKIIIISPYGMQYIVIDKDNKMVANGVSSNESFVKSDAGGFHTKERFDELYGADNWVVDFSDMHSEEEAVGRLEPNVVVTLS